MRVVLLGLDRMAAVAVAQPTSGLARPAYHARTFCPPGIKRSLACLPERLSSASGEDPARADALVTTPTALSVASPAVLASGIAGFSLTAWDVFGANSFHILPAIDKACHEFAAQLGPTSRLFWADIVLSDTFIALGIAGWLACTVAALMNRQPKAVVAVIVSWAFYVWGAGPIQDDPWLVDALKHVFLRIRPSPVHHSFSFPSGHTSSAVFTVGALLFVLLPAVLPQTASATRTPNRVLSFLSKIQGSWSVWAAAALMTGSGRVLADAHWVSDTMAASCLGLSTVSLLAWVVQRIMAARAGRPPALKSPPSP